MLEDDDNWAPGPVIKFTAEEWLARSKSLPEIYARRNAQLMQEAPPNESEPIALASVRWPPPAEKPFLTACEVLTWIGFGKPQPNEHAEALDIVLPAIWNTNIPDALIATFESGERQGGSAQTPEQVQDRIQQIEGGQLTFTELATRLREDRAKQRHAHDVLAQASTVVVKACVDGNLTVIGRCGTGADDAIPAKVFMQRHVQVLWYDAIRSGSSAPIWNDVRFRYSDVLRLWPATPECEDVQPPEAPASLSPEQNQKPHFNERVAHGLLSAQKVTGQWRERPTEKAARDFLKHHFNGISNAPLRKLLRKVWGDVPPGRRRSKPATAD